MKHKFKLYHFLILFSMVISSCSTTKNTTYVRDIPDVITSQTTTTLSQYTDPIIQPNDLLLISIQTIDPQAGNAITGKESAGIYAAQASSSNSPSATNIPGYLVDKTGNIELPLVGKIKVSGLTTSEAKDQIRRKAAQFYKEPVVNVRFANFNISVLGEVNRPAQYTVPAERVTLLDAIAMAGDMTIYGKRENVLLIREENGTKKYVRFDITKSDFMESPYFFLKQNDVIYIEASKSKVASSDYVRDRNTGYLITIATSIISIGIILLTRI